MKHFRLIPELCRVVLDKISAGAFTGTNIYGPVHHTGSKLRLASL